jgi:hypothetical protein
LSTATLPLISTIVSLIFAVTVLDQFFARRKPYQLVWAVGLFLYFLGTGTEFLMETQGLSETIYRVWYLSGAILVAAYLGMGTLYLLVRRRTAHIIMAVLGAVTVFATFGALTASIDTGALRAMPPLTGEAMPGSIRILTPFLNIFGTLALVGGAVYSAWMFLRKRILPHRVVSNILIAVGAMMPAVGGTSLRLGNPGLFYALELAGIVIIFLGFLRSREVFGFYRLPLVHGFKKVAGPE